MRIVGQRVDLSRFGPLSKEVVARVIHATADASFAESMHLADDDVSAGIVALRRSAAVACDVEMVRAGLSDRRARCYLSEVATPSPDRTRSAVAMSLAAHDHPRGAILVIGCAPTALDQVVRLYHAGELEPALVIGLPVGFVGAADSKRALIESGVPAISNVGERGGSAAAVAAFNTLARLAAAPTHERTVTGAAGPEGPDD